MQKRKNTIIFNIYQNKKYYACEISESMITRKNDCKRRLGGMLNMAKQKVCLVTSAVATVGQHLISHLVAKGYKVLALGEVSDNFTPEVLLNRQIKITTALPISAKQFKQNDVQFCFGDMSDISFLASIFAAADKGDIEIEFLFHLSAHRVIQQSSPAAYHPDYGDTVNLLEVARAYWQAHQKTFKGFFYASEKGKRSSKQIEKLITKIKEKDNFPAVIYYASPVANIGSGYSGRTSLTSLYRVIMPFKLPDKTPLAWKKDADNELGFIAGLKQAADKILAQVKSGEQLSLED